MGIYDKRGDNKLIERWSKYMARKARIRSSLNLYHVIIRGINKQDIFIDNQDKNKLIKELSIAKEKFNFKLYAYVIMPNHLHMVIKENDTSISKIMHRIQLCYSEYLNIKYQRVGHVFQGRFTSKNIENEEYLKCVIRYVHLNPDKAKIEKYDLYYWSSYKQYIEKRQNNDLVDTEEILRLFGSNKESLKEKFIEYHKEKSKYDYKSEDVEFEMMNKLDDSTLIRIITEEMNIPNIYEVQKLNNTYRDKILIELLSIRGTTAKQISRITGISINIIQKIANSEKNKI